MLRPRRQFDAEALLRVMVFNRLCDPKSKLGIHRWLEGAIVPGVDPESVTHSHLLRTMDTLVECSDALESAMAGLLRPLIDQTLSVVFYDFTTISAERQTEQNADLREYGLSKNGGVERQVMLGVVQTADGLPIHHEVFAGNTVESTTLIPTLTKILERYPIERVVVVADRGLLSLDNLEALQKMTVGNRPLEFILAVSARRYGETGRTYRGRKLSDAGVTARFYNAVTDAHLGHILKVALNSKDFEYDLDEKALKRARMLDGKVVRRDGAKRHLAKLLLVTNMPDHTPEEIVNRYKSLADIERGFRVLKSEIGIDPMFHRLPNRIRAHAMICFLALVLFRVLRMRLKAKNSPYPQTGCWKWCAVFSIIRSRSIANNSPGGLPP